MSQIISIQANSQIKQHSKITFTFYGMFTHRRLLYHIKVPEKSNKKHLTKKRKTSITPIDRI